MPPMARSAPQMIRLIHVLEELALAGRSGRTLAELSRSLGVDKATCRPMLMELTNAGYLIRNPRHRTFHLGPRLVVIGRAAEHAIDVVDVARQPLAALADETGLCALAITDSAVDLTVVDVVFPTAATARARRALGLRAGDRIPYRPPFGAVLAACSEPGEIENWRRRASESDDTTAKRIDEVLAVVRERGFAVEQFHPDPDELAEIVTQTAAPHIGANRTAALLTGPNPLGPDAMVGDIIAGADYWPVSVNAAVLNSNHEAVMAVCLVDMELPVNGNDLTGLGSAVAATARVISGHLAADSARSER